MQDGCTTSLLLQEREEAESLFEPPVRLHLDDPEKFWVSPGDAYSVTLAFPPPFMGFKMTQTRTQNWELEPFVFYAVRTVGACSPAAEDL
eukprot:1159940-Pelagomonas_calceolata.AAC.16